MKMWPVVAAMILGVAAAHAQTPYAGMQTRPIKALSEQQRQIISATFNVQRDRRTFTRDKLRESSTVVALSQSRLREQVEGLITRMNSQLVQQDPAFAKIAELMPQAVAAMTPVSSGPAESDPRVLSALQALVMKGYVARRDLEGAASG